LPEAPEAAPVGVPLLRPPEEDRPEEDPAPVLPDDVGALLVERDGTEPPELPETDRPPPPLLPGERWRVRRPQS
jgi:hypothetical protein